MRPPEVLDHQAELIDRLGSHAYGEWMGAFIADATRKNRYSTDDPAAAGHATTGQASRSLMVADAYHVQHHMTGLIRAAAADLDGTDYLVHDRLPSEHGFLIFDQPWESREIYGRTVKIAALQWWHGSARMHAQGRHRVGEGDMAPGVWVVSYADLNDLTDEVTAEIVAEDGHDELYRVLGRWHIQQMQFLSYGERVGPLMIDDDEYRQMVVAADDKHEGRRVEPYKGPLPNDQRMIVALFRLLGQTLVEVKDAPLDRGTARRAKRKNLPQRVQTIALRRKRTEYLNPPEPGSVEWKHQWYVRGRWQWRACSDAHAFAEPYEKGYHARVYVRGHWKGPVDAPVLITEKVGDLSR